MGDLRSKLRAKFPRRHSGVPSVSSSKSSTHTIESRTGNGRSVNKRPLSVENGEILGHLSRDGSTAAAGIVGKQKQNSGGSHSGKLETRQAAETTSSLGAPGFAGTPQASVVAAEGTHALGGDRDRAAHMLRQQAADQGRNTAQSDVRDITTSSSSDSEDSSSVGDDSDDTDELSASPSAHDSTTPSSNGVSASASSRLSTDTTASRIGPSPSVKVPQNATNSSSNNPGPSPSPITTGTRTNMQPTNDASSTAPIPTSATSNPDTSGRRKLSSIDENNTDNNSSPKNDPLVDDVSIDPLTIAPPPVPVVANTAPAPSSSSAVDATPGAADSVRRIRLSDLPISLNSTNPNSSKSSLPSGPIAVRSASTSSISRPADPTRRQSLLPSRQNTLIRTLLSAVHADELDLGSLDQLLPISATMATRKIWVKRPGGSATLVTINEDDLVDDVRDMILRKYANSLGRQFDAPDLTLRIAPREQQRQERVLGPEEPMARTLDAYFPGGQTVDEALIIDIPLRRTPKASPRTGPPHAQHINSVYFEEVRPPEGGTDYFGPEAIASLPATVAGAVANGTGHPHTISVLNTGQIPQIPSPGGGRARPYRERPDRPRLGRQHTSSPTILNVVGTGGHAATIAVAANHGTQQSARVPRSRTHSNASSDQSNSGSAPPPAPPLPTPPAPETAPVQIQRAATPPPRVASPRPAVARPKKKKTADHPALPAGMLNGGVPPISVLIVEDNIINLRLLEAFVKRLKVRWQTAMNGRDAVTKWRAGGFHLVLMDIQLPVMSGLEATREIRRLERMNQIGAFSTSGSDPNETKPSDEDILPNREMFKSPVIIVALTASSLQSDRHEALAAGCNDFLTKPVTYVWLERKVMEWGCMQALIDFDGWRKWKDFAPKIVEDAASAAAKKAKAKKNRLSLTNSVSETH